MIERSWVVDHFLHRNLAQLFNQTVGLRGREEESKGELFVVLRANRDGIGAATQVDDLCVADNEFGLLPEHVRVEAEVIHREIDLSLSRDLILDVAARNSISGLLSIEESTTRLTCRNSSLPIVQRRVA